MKLAFRLAFRELRGGARASLRAMAIVLACLALGVTAIAAVGTLREGVARGMAADGARILGGDLDIQGGAQPLPDTLRAWLQARGARLSDVTTLRSMLIAANGERMLVEIKAADLAWPLVGGATFEPPIAALAPDTMAVERLVAERLGLAPGNLLRLGTKTFILGAIITAEPDRVATPSVFGPRALIRLADLQATGLMQPGAIVEHHLRARLPSGTDIKALIAAQRAAFPNTGWRVRDTANAAPTVTQVLERTSLFMTLVALTALLVGGIGVANGTSAWLAARARSIATLRCLGASARLVFGVMLIQVMTLAWCGIAAGLVLGAAIPIAASRFLSGVLPVPPQLGLFPAPLAMAALYGLLTAATFALWPLGRAMRIPGAALFRDAVSPATAGRRWGLVAINAALAAALVALTVAGAAEPGFALIFCAAAMATLLLFRLGAALLTRLARVPVSGHAWLRLGLGNLYRPGHTTPLLMVSVGLGLSTLAAVALIQGNLQRQVLEQMPARAPSFFFIDIQNDQMAQFRALMAAEPGVSDLREVPSLRARIVAVNGIPAERVRATPDTAWALRGDRGLTYAATPPEGTRLAAGAWWPADYDGPPLVSFDAALAAGWSVKIGDTIRINVLGRDIDLQVANLRDIAWRSMGINFSLVASPGLLARAPHTHIATVRAEPAIQAHLLRSVTDALPNVSGIRVADVLAAVSDLLEQIAGALAATGSLTLVSGALVLVGAVIAGQQRRIRQAVVLKTLGATRRQIRAAWMVEFGLLGATAGILAATVGTAASWGVMTYMMKTDWSFLPMTLAATVLGCILLMLVFGFLGTEAALRAKAAPMLRNE